MASASKTRHVTYCIVPADLAAELHDPLRRHFKRTDVEVVVEDRSDERRGAQQRRTEVSSRPASEPDPDERRQIPAPHGRRVGDRRAPALAVEPPVALPRPAQAHAARLHFVERFQPTDEYLEDQDSTRLVTRVQSGDFEAFAQLYQRYFDRVYAYLSIALVDSRLAEQAAQDTFAAAIAALPRCIPTTRQPFRAWLLERAGEAAAEALSEHAGLSALPPERLSQRRQAVTADDPRFNAMDKLGDRELLATLEGLPARQRQVVMLRYMLALSTGEIAGVLRCSPDDVRSLDYQAMRSLSQLLRETHRARNQRELTRTLRDFGSGDLS